MSEFDRSKVVILDDEINYIGDIDDGLLHVINMKDYGMKAYGNDSEFSKLTNQSSPNLGVLEFVRRGKIVFLNLSRFGEKYALGYFPYFISEKQRVLLNDVLIDMVGYDVLADFCDKDVDENLYGDTFNDSYDEGFYEILSHTEQIVTKNKGLWFKPLLIFPLLIVLISKRFVHMNHGNL